MKPKKDISELIRENAYKLEERPSGNAWERLENRLDNQKPKRNFSSRRIWSVAAAVVGLVGFVSVISFMFQKLGSPEMAMNEAIELTPGFVVEELAVSVDNEQGFYKIVEFQKKHQDRLSNPVPEGSRKKLSVARAYKVNTPANPLNKIESENAFANGNSNSKTSTNSENLNNQIISTTPGIKKFQWLLGNWKGKINQTNKVDGEYLTIEQWKQVDARTIEGTGYLSVSNETTFAEGMTIQQIGNNIYFLADLDGSGKVSDYVLISNDGEQAVFENSSPNFPNQIIFQRNGSSSFTTILQHTSSQKPSLSQMKYLKNRNNRLVNNKITRTLQKMRNEE